MATESKSVSGSFLFKLFWWISLHINPQWAHKLMYFGLRDGSFGRTIVTMVLSAKVCGTTNNPLIDVVAGMASVVIL